MEGGEKEGEPRRKRPEAIKWARGATVLGICEKLLTSEDVPEKSRK